MNLSLSAPSSANLRFPDEELLLRVCSPPPSVEESAAAEKVRSLTPSVEEAVSERVLLPLNEEEAVPLRDGRRGKCSSSSRSVVVDI